MPKEKRMATPTSSCCPEKKTVSDWSDIEERNVNVEERWEETNSTILRQRPSS
jgi:hypothetical protein